MANSFANTTQYADLYNSLEVLFYGPETERELYRADEHGWFRDHGVDPVDYSAEDFRQTAHAVQEAHTESVAVDQAIDASLTIEGVTGALYLDQDVTAVDSSQNPTIIAGPDSHLDEITLQNQTFTASGEDSVAAQHIGQANTGDAGVAAYHADDINTGERGIAADHVQGVASGDYAAAVGGDANAPIITGTVSDSFIVGQNMTDSTVGNNNVDADGYSTVVQGQANMVAQEGSTQTAVDGSGNTLADRYSTVQQGGGNVANSHLDNSAVAGRDALNASDNYDSNLGFGSGSVTEQHVSEGGAASVYGNAEGSDDDIDIRNSHDVAVAGEDATVARVEDNDWNDIDDQDYEDIDDNDWKDIDDQDHVDYDDNDWLDKDIDVDHGAGWMPETPDHGWMPGGDEVLES